MEDGEPVTTAMVTKVFSANEQLSLAIVSSPVIRCIKPNMDKLPHKFENDMVLKQLR